jgi:riboflavin transporter FmnP
VDFTSVPTLIGGFVLGPVAAVIIEAIKILLMIIFKGTHTGYVGEFSNFVCAVAFVLPCAIIYARKKGIKWVIIGLAISIAVELVISTLSNYFVMIPLYSKFLTAEIMKIIDSGAYYYFFLPLFNLIKYVANAIIVFFVYKRISGFLHRL